MEVMKTTQFDGKPTPEEISKALETMRDEFVEEYKNKRELLENLMLEATMDEKNNRLHLTLVPRIR